MHIHSISTVATILVTVFSAGCTSVAYKYLDENKLALSNSENGVIVGSVTAPFAAHHHETVLFEFRKLGDNDKNIGVLTSGMQHTNFLIGIPSCSEGGLPQQCGRLFAISLPPGSYEIYKAIVTQRGEFQQIRPAGSTVTKGKVSYLGNLSVTFCAGMVTRHRGNIMGANVSIKDEYERDVTLIRERYDALHNVSVDKQLLSDNSWSWRVSWKGVFGGTVEPFDWGECRPLPNKAPKPTQ